MGEPLANFDNVVPALRLMLDDNAYGLSRRRVTLSTSGLVPLIDRLREECPVALAVSLHAPNDALRDRLVPINRKHPLRRPDGRVPALPARRAARFRHVRVRDARRRQRQRRRTPHELVALVRDVPCKFNLIPFNPFPGSEFRTSPRARIVAFQKRAAGRGHRDDRPQDARRRHRRRLRPARGPGQGPHQAPARDAHRPGRPHRDCSSRDASPIVMPLAARWRRARRRLRVDVDASRRRRRCRTIAAAAADPGSARAAYRAQLHAEIAAGFYERGQMDVALQELDEAVKLDPKNAKIYNVYGLVYAMLGEDAKAERNFQQRARARAERLRDPPELGLVPVHARQAARVDPRVRGGGAQSAVQDARHRADQRRQVRGRDRRQPARRGVLPARAAASIPNNATAAYNLRCSSTARRGSTRRAR